MSTGTRHQHAVVSGSHRPSHRSSPSPWGLGIRYTVMWLSAAVVVALLVANAVR